MSIADREPEMPGYAKVKEAIRDHLAGPNVMNDERARIVGRSLVDDNANMRRISAEVPRHNVARVIVVGVVAEGKRFSMPCKKRH